MINEVKLFSETLEKSKFLKPALYAGSRSKQDAEQRINTYKKVFDNYVGFKRAFKQFSSYADNDILSNQYFNATVTGLARSFAGFLTIERSMDAPKALLYWLNLIGVPSGTTVLQNIGTESISGYKNRVTWSTALTTGDDTYSTTLGKVLIPGTVKISIKRVSSTVEITDNGKGALVAPADTLLVGTVNYSTGAVNIEFSANFNPLNTDTLSLLAVEDQTGTSGINRFKTDLESIQVDTFPEVLVGESDLVSLAAMQKSLGVNIQDVVMSKLTELYIKTVNLQIVSEIDNNYTGNNFPIDLDSASFDDYRSQIDKFSGELNGVDMELANKSVKGVKATCYLAGSNVVTYFRKTKQIGLFVEEPSSYVNDLVGFYQGVPVLHHNSLGANIGYACHKTIDGNIAPVMRGIFLPMTNTPQIGNYQNPTQVSSGVFYQESNRSIVPALTQKFEIQNP